MSKRTTNLPPTLGLPNKYEVEDMNIVHDMKLHKKSNYPRPVGISLTIHDAKKVIHGNLDELPMPLALSYPWKLALTYHYLLHAYYVQVPMLKRKGSNLNRTTTTPPPHTPLG
jgi:hypothetical protein